MGLILDAISHPAVWKSSAIFVIQDDFQMGRITSAQRTTMYVAVAVRGRRRPERTLYNGEHSENNRAGTRYSAAIDLRRDGSPLYPAFTTRAGLRPFVAIHPQIDITVRNLKTAYASRLSSTLDFSRPDATPPGVLREILARNAGYKL